MAVADGTVALVGSPAEFRPPMGGVTPVSTPIERLAGVDDRAFAAAAGVVTGTRCWPGFAEPPAGEPLVALNDPPGVVGLGARARGAPEVGLESTAVRVPSTTLGVPVSDMDPVPGDSSKADAPFDSGGEAIVAAGATYAWRRDAHALAVAIQAKK